MRFHDSRNAMQDANGKQDNVKDLPNKMPGPHDADLPPRLLCRSESWMSNFLLLVNFLGLRFVEGRSVLSVLSKGRFEVDRNCKAQTYTVQHPAHILLITLSSSALSIQSASTSSFPHQENLLFRH